jgi:uncharacterized membrane protein HdeD (DUF308 family)
MTIESIEQQTKTAPWWLVLIEGIAAVIVGILLYTSTGTTMVVLVQILGLYWLIKGIIEIISIFIDSSQWGWKLFGGIVGILAGILILQHPLWSAWLVPGVTVIVIGIFGIIIGLVGLVRAFQGGGWGLGILAVLSLLMGILLIANPLFSAALFPFVLGAFAFVGGIAAIVMAFRMR